MKPKAHIISIYVMLLMTLSQPALAQDWIYTTRPGDNLWDISKTYLKSVNDWKKLREYNEVTLPKQLSPGIRLRIPIAWLKHQPESVKVTYTRGDVKVLRSNGKEQDLRQDDQLYIGDRIISSKESSATLSFADGSIILLEAESELILDSLSAFEKTGMVDTRMRLQRGGLETQVIPLKKPKSRFEIITPAAVAAVRGTRYRVDVDTADSVMRAEVLEGEVSVANAKAGKDVAMGYGTLAEKGKAPLPPRKLLSPPDMTNIPSKVRRLPYKIEWPILAGSHLYRVQLVTMTEPESVIFDTEVKQEQLNLSDIDDGQYKIKIRGLDEIGLEGLNGSATILIDTSLMPALSAPTFNEPVIEENQALVSWQGVENAEYYLVEVATDVEFNDIVKSEKANEENFKITLSGEAAELYVRVKSAAEYHQPGTYGETQKIVIEDDGLIYFITSVLLIFLI